MDCVQTDSEQGAALGTCEQSNKPLDSTEGILRTAVVPNEYITACNELFKILCEEGNCYTHDT